MIPLGERITRLRSPNPEGERMPLQIGRRLWRFLGRIDVVVVLLAIALALLFIGSLFPQQGPGLMTDPVLHANWDQLVTSRYGTLAVSLERLGVFRWYQTPAFIASLVLLSLSTLVCTVDRWRTIWHRVLQRQVVCSDGALQQARLSMPLGRIQVSEPGPLIRQALEEQGFRVRFEEHQGTLHLRGDRNALAPAATLVSHLGVVLALFVILITAGSVWREPLAIPANGTVALQHEPELSVGFRDFKIERYPDGSAADYQAAVYVLDGTRTVRQGVLRLNEPLTYTDIGLNLQGFSGPSVRQTLLVQAVHDPGYGYVVAAGLMVVIGFAVSFNFPHSCVRVRIGPEGEAWLAGFADRHAYGFDAEFGVLADRFKHILGVAERTEARGRT